MLSYFMQTPNFIVLRLLQFQCRRFLNVGYGYEKGCTRKMKFMSALHHSVGQLAKIMFDENTRPALIRSQGF